MFDLKKLSIGDHIVCRNPMFTYDVVAINHTDGVAYVKTHGVANAHHQNVKAEHIKGFADENGNLIDTTEKFRISLGDSTFCFSENMFKSITDDSIITGSVLTRKAHTVYNHKEKKFIKCRHCDHNTLNALLTVVRAKVKITIEDKLLRDIINEFK